MMTVKTRERARSCPDAATSQHFEKRDDGKERKDNKNKREKHRDKETVMNLVPILT